MTSRDIIMLRETQMNSHTIIYLDQNYVSYMAKARIGRIKDDDQAKFWLSLFDNLKKAVLADKIACPESDFHSTEAMFDIMGRSGSSSSS